MDKLRIRVMIGASILLLTTVLPAQQQGGEEKSADQLLNQEALLNNVTAGTNVKEISLGRFEDAEFWQGKMEHSDGYVEVKSRPSSGPESRSPLPAEAENKIQSEERSILGIKVHYYRRNTGEIEIVPARPIPVEGVVKQISLWVASRNRSHVLKAVVRDLQGVRSELYLGSLAFHGWQQMVATVPPYLTQIDYRDPRIKSGVVIERFKIVSDVEDSVGEFYLYFDDLRARTDLYHIEGFDQVDDPSDNW